MNEITRMYIYSLLGQPYRWGGDDTISGFDCSGLVIEILQSRGQYHIGHDTTSMGLFNHYKGQGAHMTAVPKFGCIAFYGRGFDKITHVAYCLDSRFIVEASGGGSRTRTEGDAAVHNAFVKIRPIKYRKDFLGMLDVSSISIESYFL